ncbi:hypothetical protein SAMN04488074_11363 [Lentzea albidocapillata subsp. violacea]|uniref:Uncharacterized protein n=1 Tax=Lentzea albidocapillata subsp. violacea TaxID=128104 RepID=A0A1G9ML14_9PSEU|nr:hypothetical protein [Lentzea albidocapillata]SDL74899.1 hypothetical protein SAMN04488074_11363 [Lentzea albidocapillata subsp. violacea]
MHIPAALYEETKELPRPRSLLVLPAAIFPLLVVVLPFATMGAIFEVHWGWWLGGFAAALAWATASGFIARSPNPVGSVVRLLGWAVLWCLEPLLLLMLLAPVASVPAAAIVIGVMYLCGALLFGYWLFLRYRAKR